MSDGVNTGKKHRGLAEPWKPGQSGNPSGRPRGARAKATVIVEKLFMGDSDVEEIARNVVTLAKGGDQWAIDQILKRVAPPRRDNPITLDLPKIESVADLPGAVAAVIEAMAMGDIDPSEAASAVAVLEANRRALEVVDLDARLKAIEEMMRKK